MNAHIWARVAAAIQESQSAQQRLDESKESWEHAKSTREERQKAHDEAERAAAAEHPIDLPAKVWKTLQGLYSDRARAEETFEVADRKRRKDADLVKTLDERILKLNHEAFGGDTKLQFDGKSPPWQGVELADFMGELLATPYIKAGVRTLADAKAACEDDKAGLKHLVADGELTTEQGLYLRSKTIERLGAFAVEHTLGKARKVEIPDTEKRGSAKPPTKAQVDAAAPAQAAAEAAVRAGGPPPKTEPAAADDRPIDLLVDHGVADRAVATLKRAEILTLGDLQKARPGAHPGTLGRLTLIKGITSGDEAAIEEAVVAISAFGRSAAPTPAPKPKPTVVKPPAKGRGKRALA